MPTISPAQHTILSACAAGAHVEIRQGKAGGWLHSHLVVGESERKLCPTWEIRRMVGAGMLEKPRKVPGGVLRTTTTPYGRAARFGPPVTLSVSGACFCNLLQAAKRVKDFRSAATTYDLDAAIEALTEAVEAFPAATRRSCGD